MSDRIVVMNGGIAEQVGAPFEIYNNPRTRFVAGFVGTLNMFTATVEAPEDGLLTRCRAKRCPAKGANCGA